MNLLSIQDDPKTIKGEKFGYITAIQYLAPSDASGVNVCAFASDGCRAGCLFKGGMVQAYPTINKARLARTMLFNHDKNAYFEKLIKEIQAFLKKADKSGKIPVIRLNGMSDLPWENIKHNGKTIFEWFPSVQFYDYTKNPYRMNKVLSPNYYLVFSRSESNNSEVEKLLKTPRNIAVVFNQLPDTFMGRKVIDGDISDLRFLDKQGVIVGLKAKGKAKKDTTGFVIRA